MLNPQQVNDEAERLAQRVRDWLMDPTQAKAIEQVRFADPNLAIEVAAKTARIATGIEPLGQLPGNLSQKQPGRLKVEVTLSWINTGAQPWAVRVEAMRL